MPGEYRRGDVVEIDLSPIDLGITVGRELRKTRPCVILQNDIGNANSSTTIVAAISSAEAGHKLFPVIVFVPKGEAGLLIDSLVLCNQIRTVSKALPYKCSITASSSSLKTKKSFYEANP